MKLSRKILVRPRGLRASLLYSLLALGMVAAAGDLGLGQSHANAQERAVSQESGEARDLAVSGNRAYATTLRYVVHFYPRWFTYSQENHTSTNRLVGPDRMTPIYHDVVAPNDDTLYVSSFVDLTQQPAILTIPSTTATYSLLILDPYGDVLNNGIILPAALEAGTYALVGPNWSGTLPAGVTQLSVPLNVTQWIIRADKYSSTGENQTCAAAQFRSSLRLGTLSEYLTDPSATVPVIVPVELASIPFKGLADYLCVAHPIKFLKQLQIAVASPGTPPLSSEEQALSDRFNRLFARRAFDLSAFENATREAHSAIVADYHTNLGTNNWIHFTNIGIWTTSEDLDRSAITEYIQYGNGIATAAYYQTFRDSNGHPLYASDSRGYVLTFPADQIPQASRFWSVTAYIPGSVTLVPNDANKYVVASYTPGLQTNADGSITIYMFPTFENGIPPANWLPVPRGRFNIMLRDYGPLGSVADNTYVPPPIIATETSELSK